MPGETRRRQEERVGGHPLRRSAAQPHRTLAGLTRRWLALALLAAIGLGAGAIGAAAPLWKALAPLPAPRQENAVVALVGRIYVIGGFDGQGRVIDTVDMYDPARDHWASRQRLPMPLHHVNAAAVGGKIYVVGALGGDDFGAVGATYEYDPMADAWTAKSPMPAGTERGASGVAVIGDRLYVAGGLRGGTSVGDFSAYDPAADRWEGLPAMPGPRDHLVAAAAGGVFYAIGGRGAAVGLSGRTDAFDPKTRVWSARRAMPTPRAGSATGVVADRIIVVGGEGNRARANGVFPEAEAYNPAADTWVSLPPMPTPRHGTGAVGIGGKLYVPAGATRAGFGAVAANEQLDLGP